MNLPKPLECEVLLEVPFYDVDPMHVVWHGHYIKYFEAARTALFDLCNVDLFQFQAEEGVVFPIIRSSVKHIRPLQYRDRFLCKARLREAAVKIGVEFEIRLAESGILCATGSTEQAAVRLPEFELQFSIPVSLQKALGVWSDEQEPR